MKVSLSLVYQFDNDMVHEMERKEKIIIWELEDYEQEMLKSIILGHGNLKKAADTSGVKTRTIERIALTGKGLKRNIVKIRKKLIAPTNLQNENEESK
jgi:hypothetical protein